MAGNSPSLKSLIKTGFGISIGFFLSQILFIMIGLVFFIPGYLMFLKGSKDKKKGSQIGGLVLMAIGVIIMTGGGLGILMDSIGDM